MAAGVPSRIEQADGGEVMRILIAHSYYQSGSASGENQVVQDEFQLLQQAEHSVELFAPYLNEPGPEQRLSAGLNLLSGHRILDRFDACLEKHRPDIVHFHNLFPGLSPVALRRAKLIGAKVVVTLHNYRLACLPGTFYRNGRICEQCKTKAPWRGVIHSCYRDSTLASLALATSLTFHRSTHSFDKVDRFLAVSEFVKQKHIEIGIGSDRIRVKPNFAWPMSRRQGPGEFFLYLGRLTKEKGVDLLTELAPRLQLPIVVAGDGPELQRLRQQATSNAHFLGRVDAHQARALIAKARALIITSRWFEGSPRTITEAYAAGVPVVATDIGPMRTLVNDGITGKLVGDQRPVETWLQVLGSLASDGESETLGENAYKLWETEYSPQIALRALEEIYEELSR